MGFGLVNWIFCIYTTQHGATSNYSATANLHNSQITTACTKPFQACFVFTIHSLGTTDNSEDSSTSHSQVVPSLTLVQNCHQLFPQLNWIIISSQPPLQSSTVLNCSVAPFFFNWWGGT
jgi:hypothetical protein